jgi:hypothetical protein
MRPTPNLETAFGHEHHAAPAADIRDRALVADEKGPILDQGPGADRTREGG